MYACFLIILTGYMTSEWWSRHCGMPRQCMTWSEKWRQKKHTGRRYRCKISRDISDISNIHLENPKTTKKMNSKNISLEIFQDVGINNPSINGVSNISGSILDLKIHHPSNSGDQSSGMMDYEMENHLWIIWDGYRITYEGNQKHLCFGNQKQLLKPLENPEMTRLSFECLASWPLVFWPNDDGLRPGGSRGGSRGETPGDTKRVPWVIGRLFKRDPYNWCFFLNPYISGKYFIPNKSP